MEPRDRDGYVSAPARVVAFVRGFLPEQTLQLLFPLASLLLLLGATYPWYHLPITGFRLGTVANSLQAERAVLALRRIGGWPEAVPELLVRFGFFASLVLWTLPVRNIRAKLRLWVGLPAGAALVGYPAFLVLTASQRNASLDDFAKFSHSPVSISHSSFHSLGNGWCLTLAGLAVLVICLILIQRNVLSLPVRFRGNPRLGDIGSFTEGRDVFVFVIGTMILTIVSSIPLFFSAVLRMQIAFARSSTFPIAEWAVASLDALAAACLALFLLRKWRRNIPAQLPRMPLLSACALGLVLPLGTILVPRVFLKALELHLVPTPFDWSEMLVPRPIPWIFLVYVTAFFVEFAIRGYLQTILERRFSLAKAIFLTGLLWGLLPLGFGVAQTFPLGVSALARSLPTTYLSWFGALVIYSVPLGWLYARTRSIIPVALMHGTIALFHVGWGYEIHINHPQLYWVELGLWIVVGWYMFKRYPVQAAAVQSVEPEPA